MNVEGGNVCGGWIFFFKISNHDFMFIREMRVPNGHLKSEICGPNVAEKYAKYGLA